MKTILLIDSGNTRLKVAVIAAGANDDEIGDIQVHALRTDDVQGFKDRLASLPAAPVAALGTNVAGAARAGAIETALASIGCPLRWIVPQAQAYGLTSRYTKPELLGADRWVSMLGVLARRNAATGIRVAEALSPFLLASFGTATTMDTVSAEGIFEGGLILPGPALMRRSLASGTANLPLAQGQATEYPTDTQQAISSGVVAAQAGALLRQWLAGLRRYGAAPDIYTAGGGWEEVEAEARRLLTDTAAVMGCLPPAITVIENPVLYGLAHIAAASNWDLF